MTTVGGYILPLSSDRLDAFVECVEEGNRFGEPVIDFQHSRNVPLICFVIHDNKVTHVALGHRGLRAGTGLRRLNLERAEELSAAISVTSILSLVPARNQSHVKDRFGSGGLLTSKGFDAVADALRQLSPQSISILEKYSRERTDRIERLSPEARQGLAYQKETILTALSLADFSREALQDWEPADTTPTSFLEGLPAARLREDPMVVHDFMNLPGYDLIKTLPYNAAVFESESERLTVIVANRQPLEAQTGADLIYYNETYECFVMVQYKAMEKETDKNGVSQAVFRLPNGQLAEEIERMEKLGAALKACGDCDTHHGFRLTDNPFFLKLCPRIIFRPDDIGLVPGMYIPIDYWKRLEKHPNLKGPRGGMHVTYENVGRYFDNTSFAAVVANAWIGTTPPQSTVLREIVRTTLETGRAITIAIKTKQDSAASSKLQPQT